MKPECTLQCPRDYRYLVHSQQVQYIWIDHSLRWRIAQVTFSDWPTLREQPEMQGRSYSVERNFGLLVGLVFSALGGWWLIRGKFQSLASVVLGVGAVLVILGVSFPRALVIPNRLWMKLAEALSFVMTRVILALVFFLVAMPIGLMRKMVGGDPLNRRAAPTESYWRPYLERQTDRRHYEKMY
jgi:hypothetical protein